MEAVDGRKGIDGLTRLCQEKLQAHPFSGCLVFFRSRRGTSIRILVFDGQGSWLVPRHSELRSRWRVKVLVLENDFRWQHICWVLSLDDVLVFFEELWIQVPDKLRFVSGLRSVLSPFMNDQNYFLSNPGLTSYAAFQWFKEDLGLPELSRLIAWANRVFINSASERSAEWAWSMLSANLSKDPARRVTIPVWVSDLFVQLRIEEVQGREMFEERLEGQFELQPSDWDRSALLVRNTTRDSVRTTLALIANRNIFVRSWAQVTSGMKVEKLLELYDVGRRLAAEYSLDSQGLAFPGSWAFELLPTAPWLGNR